ncbi:MAG TPA: helix-turn-helix domain-containing protein, partial [Mycobacterium sp.]
MRADARKNRDHLLAIASTAISEQGVDVSMRDIARRADVGLATLLRHFPTREALLDALLRTSFDELTATAGELEVSNSPEDALVRWLRECVAWTTEY